MMAYEEDCDSVGCSEWYNEQNDQRIQVKKRRERSFKLVPILRKELMGDELPLIEYHTVFVSKKNLICKLLPLLPALPSEVNHLKRIKDGQILIQPTFTPLSDQLVEQLRVCCADVTFASAMVPARKPNSRAQFIWAKNYWPTCFHPNHELEALLSGNFFSAKEHQKIIDFYEQAEKVAGDKCGCVMVNPRGKIVIKRGSNSEPLGHAVMVAIGDYCKQQKEERKKRSVIDGSMQYIGNGFDVYLTDEPCGMCAMALVHFRVRRVFYGKRSITNGVLESCWRIQEEKNLNHHYKVVRIDEII